jgi:hypothetical protein
MSRESGSRLRLFIHTVYYKYKYSFKKVLYMYTSSTNEKQLAYNEGTSITCMTRVPTYPETTSDLNELFAISEKDHNKAMSEYRRRYDGETLQEHSFGSSWDPEPMLLSDNHPMRDPKVDRRLLEQRDLEIHRLRMELAEVREQLRDARMQLKLATIQPIPHDEDVTMESQSMSGHSLGLSTFTPSKRSSGFSAAIDFLWKTSAIVESDDEVSGDGLHPTKATPQGSEEERLDMVFQQLVLDPYGDKGVYTGQISKQSGWPHGHGRLQYEDSGTHQRIYDGEWCHGRWHGVGKANFANGDSYDGDYKLDQRHGYGSYLWADGRSYEGQFQDDKRHGKGTFRWPDGSS